MDFKEKVVIITGSASGIGESCTRRLLDLDAKVAGFDIKPVKNTNGNYKHYLLDVRDNNGIRVAVDDVERRFEKIDALINCAGIFSSSKPFYEMTIEEWDTIISTNLTGTFLCSKYVAKKIIKKKKGKIVNISCIRSRIFRPYMADYSASKGGVGETIFVDGGFKISK